MTVALVALLACVVLVLADFFVFIEIDSARRESEERDRELAAVGSHSQKHGRRLDAPSSIRASRKPTATASISPKRSTSIGI